MTTASYAVQGMTCEHCVRAVSQEVARIPGVDAVQVDLATGSLTVTSEAPVDDDAISAAVDEAGYRVA